MLTRKQITLIDQKGISTLHDFRVVSLVSGEPNFEDGILSYYDGRLVTICGFPLRGEPPIDANRLREVSRFWSVRRSAEGIDYVGPHYVDFRFLRASKFRCVERFKGNYLATELVIDCNGGSEELFKLRLYKRSRSRGFQATVKRGGILSAEHFRLIETFYGQREVTNYLAEMAFVLPALLSSRRLWFIEARKGGRLCGFLTLHACFRDLGVALFLYHDEQTPGVSDFLYSEMLNHAHHCDIAVINIGPSLTRGHYNFKLKWGGKPALPPYYLIRWLRGRLSRRYHTSWGPRIVGL